MRTWIAKVFVVGYFAGIIAIGCDTSHFAQGKILFDRFCSNCHGEDGKGLQQLIPPLAGADYLKKHQSSLPCLIRNGITDTISVNGKEYSQAMPGVPKLSDFEIQNVINYINSAWGNQHGFTKISQVREALKSCKNKPFE